MERSGTENIRVIFFKGGSYKWYTSEEFECSLSTSSGQLHNSMKKALKEYLSLPNDSHRFSGMFVVLPNISPPLMLEVDSLFLNEKQSREQEKSFGPLQT